MKSLWTALSLALLTSLLTPYASASDDSPAIEGVTLRAGDLSPTDGLLLSVPEVRALDRLLADLEGRAKVAEAASLEMEAKLELARAEAKEAEIRLAGAVATIEAEKAKRPTWLESHVGGCLGVGAVYDGEVSGGIVIGYGWQW